MSGCFQAALCCVFTVEAHPAERPITTSPINRHLQRNWVSVDISSRLLTRPTDCPSVLRHSDLSSSYVARQGSHVGVWVKKKMRAVID